MHLACKEGPFSRVDPDEVDLGELTEGAIAPINDGNRPIVTRQRH
jgi:hypothetical protein